MAKKPPLRNPFVQIEGQTYLVLDWYDQAEHQMPNELRLQRLKPNEVKDLHQILTYHEAYARLIVRVRKRLGYIKPHDTDDHRKK